MADCDAADPTDGGLLLCCGGITTFGGGPDVRFICVPLPEAADMLFMYGAAADCWFDVDCGSCGLMDGLQLCGEESILHLFVAGAPSVNTSITINSTSLILCYVNDT